jgi:hypothetical protein
MPSIPRDLANIPKSYRRGWNIRYTTDLTEPVWFYIRGEEFSAQLDYFVNCIERKSIENVSSFATAVETDRVIAMIASDAEKGAAVRTGSMLPDVRPQRKRSLLFWTRPISRRSV